MTTEWRRYESSRINRDSECSRCNTVISPVTPRYVMKGHSGWIAMCVRCYDSLAVQTTANLDEYSATTVQQASSSTPSYAVRDERIARAHEENMESAKQTRNCLVLLQRTMDRLAMAVEKLGEAKQ